MIDQDKVFDALDELVEYGWVQAYGVSVETVNQALTALARPNLASIQIILNVFRRKPLERVLPEAAAAGVGVIALVIAASQEPAGQRDASDEAHPRRGGVGQDPLEGVGA